MWKERFLEKLAAVSSGDGRGRKHGRVQYFPPARQRIAQVRFMLCSALTSKLSALAEPIDCTDTAPQTRGRQRELAAYWQAAWRAGNLGVLGSQQAVFNCWNMLIMQHSVLDLNLTAWHKTIRSQACLMNYGVLWKPLPAPGKSVIHTGFLDLLTSPVRQARPHH